MRGRVSPGPSVGGGSALSMSQARFYYLHPLLAGPTELWGGHFARAAAMGFDAVVVAPPFRAGQRGDLFRTADHDRLDPRLGDASAGAALAQAAEAAADRRLRLFLDLVLDEVAAESPLARGEAGWYRAEADDEPPDPRRPPPQPDLARLCPGAERSGLAACWAARLAEWADAGVAGFRCLRPQRVPAGLWRELIATLRRRHPDAEFIAWTAGLAPAEAAALGDCGFDYTACCCRGWDYRAGGVAETLDSLARLAPPLLAPEAPFERRLGRGLNDSGRMRREAERALAFAAACGAGWLMPMGFEFGAARDMDPARDRPEDFGRLAGALLDGGAAAVGPDGVIALAPGEVRVLRPRATAPVARRQIDATEAAAAPRIAVEAVSPAVDDGRFAAKRLVGEMVEVTADVIADGHDRLAAALLWRAEDEAEWHEAAMTPLGNDRWIGRFPLARLGRHLFTVLAWKDRF